MAKRKKHTTTAVISDQTAGRAPRATWAMGQASMARRFDPKYKDIKTRMRREGQAQCDRRAW